MLTASDGRAGSVHTGRVLRHRIAVRTDERCYHYDYDDYDDNYHLVRLA